MSFEQAWIDAKFGHIMSRMMPDSVIASLHDKLAENDPETPRGRTANLVIIDEVFEFWDDEDEDN